MICDVVALFVFFLLQMISRGAFYRPPGPGKIVSEAMNENFRLAVDVEMGCCNRGQVIWV